MQWLVYDLWESWILHGIFIKLPNVFFPRTLSYCWCFSCYYSWCYYPHCVKSVHSQSFSGPYFPVFRLNTERYGVSLHIQSEYGKIRTRKTPNMETFHALLMRNVSLYPTGNIWQCLTRFVTQLRLDLYFKLNLDIDAYLKPC